MSDKEKTLFNRGYAYLGMIREAEMRATLLKERVLKKSKNDELDDETLNDIERELVQIEQDLDTYTRKLNRVSEELERHVKTTEME